jgi:hypothetical protein
MAQEGHPNPASIVLVGHESKHRSAAAQGLPERGGIPAAFEKEATAPFPQAEEHPGGRPLAKPPIRGGELNPGERDLDPRKELEIPEVAKRDHGTPIRVTVQQGARAGETRQVHVGCELLPGHGGGSQGAGVALAQAPEVFAGQRMTFGGAVFGAQTAFEIRQGDPAVASVDIPRQAPASTPDVGDPTEWYRLKHGQGQAHENDQEPLAHSTEADLVDAVMEVLGPGDDLDLDPHEIDGEIASIELGKADRILLGGDEDFRHSLFRTIDGVEQFLLGKAVMIREPLGVDQLAAKLPQALLEAFRLGDAAEGGDALA